MVIQDFKLSLPYDFLEHLIVTKSENKDRNFTAVFGPTGESIDDGLSNCTVKAKTSNLNVQLSFKSTSDYFHTRDNYLNCTIYKWKVCDEDKSEIQVKDVDSSEYFEKNVPSKDVVSEIALKHDYSSASRKRIALNDDISEESDNPKKQKVSHESQKSKSKKTIGSLLTKYKAKSTNSNGTTERTVSRESQRKNLRPRNTKIDWSTIAGDSCGEDDFGDDDDDDDDDDNDGTYHPSEDDDDDVSGRNKGHQSSSIPRCFVIVPRTAQFQPNRRQQDVKNPDIKTSEESVDKHIPEEPHPSTSKVPDDGIKKTKQHVLNMKIAFPLQEVAGALHVCGGEAQSRGRCEPLRMSLVNTDGTVSRFHTNILFLSDLSKGPISRPRYFPKKFQVLSVKEGMSMLIVIFPQRNDCTKKVVTKKHTKKVRLSKKLLELQEKEQLIEFSAPPSTPKEPKEPPTIDNLFGMLNTTANRVVVRDSRYTIENKLLKLKAKLSTSEPLPLTPNEESSDNSEAEYPDEMQFVQAPALSVSYASRPRLKDLNSIAFSTVQAGNIIPVLNYALTSSYILRTKEDLYYVQGKMKDVNGLVLLGPFSMNYQPRPFLNFIPVDEPAVRVPQDVYQRRRKRWLRKHDKKIFTRPSGGVLADKAAAFIDHDYFSGDLASQTHFSNDAVCTAGYQTEEAPGNNSEDLILVSTHGLDHDTPHISTNREDTLYSHHGEMEDQIPVVGSLEEAMRPGTLGNPVPERTDFGEAQEEVQVDTRDLPMVMSEVSIYTSGFQTDAELVERNMQKKDEGPREDSALVIENDTTFKIEKQYICKFCPKVMGNNVGLANHVRLYHKNCPGYIQYTQEMIPQKLKPQKVNLRKVKVCEHCDTKRSFITSDGLRNHMIVHHADKLAPSVSKKVSRTCTICKKLFSSPTILRKHMMRLHENVQYLCHICANTFKNPESLASHIKGQHENIREYACSLCSGAFVTSEYLRKHVRKVHNKVRDKVAPASNEGADGEASGEKPPTSWKKTSRTASKKQCFMCQYSFDRRNMKMHLRQIHGIEWKDPIESDDECTIRKCVQCSLEFYTRSEIEFHRFHVHDYNYKLNCVYCGHAFIQRSSMNDHILSAHCSINVHECFLCGADCEKASILREHMKRKHPDSRMEDGMKFTCIHCPASFNTRQLLLHHLVSSIHFSLFTHACLTCPQRFQKLCDLEHHLKVVHNTESESQFEIICQSSDDPIVHLVVQKDVTQLGDLPRNAQLALARLQREGKQVMIITKPVEETDESSDLMKITKEGTESKTSTPTKSSPRTVKTSISSKKLPKSNICKPYEQQTTKVSPSRGTPKPQPKTVYHVGTDGKIAPLPTTRKTPEYTAVHPPNTSTSSHMYPRPANVVSNSPFRALTVLAKAPSKTGLSRRKASRMVRTSQPAPQVTKVLQAEDLLSACQTASVGEETGLSRRQASQMVRTSQPVPQVTSVLRAEDLLSVHPTTAEGEEADRAVASLQSPELDPCLVEDEHVVYQEIGNDETEFLSEQEMFTEDLLRLLQSTMQ